jgi:hypothetical protein
MNGRHEILNHPCSREELGLTEDVTNSMFMPVYKSSLEEVNTYSKKLQCVDRESLEIHGDYNSYKAQQFNI